jgi:NAD(P)-dependent dehydrogenase (short-subunit alcohol dehydrogenase family)
LTDLAANPTRRPLAGQVVIVTGAANGIGAATARRFLAEGALVAAADLDGAGVAETLSEAPAGRAFAMGGDCTDAAFMEEFVAKAQATLGPASVLFNNVGQSARERGGPFLQSQEEVWRFVIEVSLLTAMRTSRLVAPGMRERGYGRIINMSSNSAFAGESSLVDYAAAKMGVVGFTRGLARELAPHGVTVNVVAPGAIRTRAHDKIPPATLAQLKAATPAGFVAEVDDVAGVVAFLAGPDARFITGQTLLIDGGRWMI